jgi:predicted transcriptional regulator YdeE
LDGKTFMNTIIATLCGIMGVASGNAAEQNTTQTFKETMKDYTVVEKPSLIVVGIECRTSNSPDAGPHDIPKLWGRFYSENILSQIPNKASNEVVALYCDYEGNYTQPYTCLIGCPVTSLSGIPSGLTVKVIPAGSFARFRAIGEHPQTLIETWGRIWQDSIERNRAYTGDFEVYGDKFFSGRSQEVEVYIAIKEANPN